VKRCRRPHGAPAHGDAGTHPVGAHDTGLFYAAGRLSPSSAQ
jgi:hypothetical protein